MQCLVESDPVDLETKISKFQRCIFSVSLLYFLEKGQIPSLAQYGNPFAQGCFTQNLDQFGTVGKSVALHLNTFRILFASKYLESSLVFKINDHSF